MSSLSSATSVLSNQGALIRLASRLKAKSSPVHMACQGMVSLQHSESPPGTPRQGKHGDIRTPAVEISTVPLTMSYFSPLLCIATQSTRETIQPRSFAFHQCGKFTTTQLPALRHHPVRMRPTCPPHNKARPQAVHLLTSHGERLFLEARSVSRPSAFLLV